MHDSLDVPPELQHLIEKRESEDRRTGQRRDHAERRQIDLGPLGSADSIDELESREFQDRRSDEDRRENRERREKARRQADKTSDSHQ
jgi:hypothetical protein